MLQMIPLMDSEGNLTHYLGLQQELPEFTKFEHCPDRAPGQDYTGRARRGPDDAAAGDSVDDVLASLGVGTQIQIVHHVKLHLPPLRLGPRGVSFHTLRTATRLQKWTNLG